MSEKTKCCNLEYWGENHNPVRDDGYCMGCGYHPAIEALKDAVDVIEFYANEDSYDQGSDFPEAAGYWEPILGREMGIAGSKFVYDKGEMAREFLEFLSNVKIKELK